MFFRSVLPLNRIYLGDNLALIEELDDASVDLVFYSPPYWDTHKYSASEHEIGHGQTLEEYLHSLQKLNLACARVLKPTGNLIINVMDLVRENNPLHLADFIIDDCALRLNRQGHMQGQTGNEPFVLVEKIVWYIRNKMPVSSHRRFCNKYEWMIHLAKSDAYFFDKDRVREPHGKYGATDAKKRPEKWHPLGKDPGNSWDLEPTPRESAQGDVGDHWDVKAYRVSGKRKFHKAAFPIELSDRVVRAWCPQEGVVLDPFVGSGTTCLSAVNHDRDYIGFELDVANFDTAWKRLRGELV